MAFSNDIKRRIILDNLRMQERIIAEELEVRRSHLSDLVAVLCAPYKGSAISVENLRTIGSDAVFTEHTEVGIHREVREDTKESIVSALGAVTAYDRAVIAELICTRFAHDGHPFTLSDFLVTETSNARIAYMRNAYTDEAYDVLSSALTDSTAFFTDSYEDACIEVAEGNAGYCILPWRDTSGAFLRATLTYLEAYHLIAISTVTVTDGEDIPMQYALVGQATTPVPALWEMVVALPNEWIAEGRTFFSALAHFGISVAGVHVSRGVLYTLRASVPPARLLVWLNLFAPGYQIRGFYPDTEEFEL